MGENILLAIMLIAIFAFGYYIVDRFGKFMEDNYRRSERSPGPKRSNKGSGSRKRKPPVI